MEYSFADTTNSPSWWKQCFAKSGIAGRRRRRRQRLRQSPSKNGTENVYRLGTERCRSGWKIERGGMESEVGNQHGRIAKRCSDVVGFVKRMAAVTRGSRSDWMMIVWSCCGDDDIHPRTITANLIIKLWRIPYDSINILFNQFLSM